MEEVCVLYPVIELFSMRISVFSILLLVAISACFLVYTVNRKYVSGYISLIFRCFVIAIVGAGVGGRLLSALTLLQSSAESFINNLVYGGFVFYGGAIGGLVGLLVFINIKKLPALDLIDVFVSLMPLGQAIGRIGCYMSGCCYGFEYDGFLSVPYVIDGVQIRVFPTWFLESGVCLLLALFFQVLYRGSKRGMHTAMYSIAYSLFRFTIEFFRGDDVRGIYGGISISQIISIVVFIAGVCVLVQSHKKDIDNELFAKCSNKQPCVYRI